MKKNALVSMAFIAMLLIASVCKAQNNSLSEIKIKTFFHCANGKALIERELIKEDGIKEVIADVTTKEVTIRYNPEFWTKEKLVEAIEKIGYLTEFSEKDKKINKACSHGDDKEGEHKHEDHNH